MVVKATPSPPLAYALKETSQQDSLFSLSPRVPGLPESFFPAGRAAQRNTHTTSSLPREPMFLERRLSPPAPVAAVFASEACP